MMWGPYGGGMMGWGVGVMIAGIVFLGFIVIGVVLMLRGTNVRPSAPSRSRALDVLDERYARGEIDKQEYDERRHVLQERAGQ